ncbi:outer membrane homotrimeric porin [Humidesulfovibrio sp.]
MKKRIALSLALLAGLAMGATTANAADIKATGSWQVDAVFSGDNFFSGAPTNQKTVTIEQRIRTSFQFIANENLKGVLEVQYGPGAWGGTEGLRLGDNGAGRGAASTADNALHLRKAYIDFNWPGTKNRFLVGHQSLSLPAAFGSGSAILDHHMSAAAAIIPITDSISLVGGYTRPYDGNNDGTTTTNNDHGTSADAVFLYSNMKFSGFSVNPFLAYLNAGANVLGANSGATTGLAGMDAPGVGSDNGLRSYWAGTSFNVTVLDPFKIRGDINYGKATYNVGSNNDSGRSGWLADLAVEYTGLSMMTPEVFFVYSSGEDGTTGKSERMPVLRTQNWGVGSFWMQGGSSTINRNNSAESSLGFWAAGLSLKDIKLIDKLSHTFNVIYFKGTNDKDIISATGLTAAANYGRMLTEKDSLVEIDLNSKYMIYDELSLGLELGYIFTDFDKNVWAAAGSSDIIDQNAYKAAFMLNYSF